MTTDCTPRYCYADPFEGGKQAVAEAYRNLCAVGARPLAVTNCLNFGNPQRPEIMAQIVGCLQGMSEACLALDMPIVSGNVSPLQREQGDRRRQRDPADPGDRRGRRCSTIGRERRRSGSRPRAKTIVLIGQLDATAMSASRCGSTRLPRQRTTGRRPPVDLARRAPRRRIRPRADRRRGMVTAVHDVSDGGLLVAIAEMALAGDIGANA